MVSGARAECSGRSGAGGTAAAVAATRAAVKAATGAAVEVTAAAVCGGSVRGATKVAAVDDAAGVQYGLHWGRGPWRR